MARQTRRVCDLHRAIATLATAALIAAAAAHPSAQPSVMDPSAFATELERLSRLISDAPLTTVPRLDVPAVWTVEAEGQRYEMPAGWLQRDLERARSTPAEWPAQRGRILAQLAALKAEAVAFDAYDEGRHRASTETARGALSNILAGPEFRHMSQKTAMDAMRARVTRWILRMWERLGGERLGRRSTTLVFAWIVALTALAGLIVWLRRSLRTAPDGRFALTAAPPPRQSARAWARAARAAADPREAARCAYRAVLSSLEEEGALRGDETRTPREFLGLLPATHRRRGLLTDVTRRFEEIWYGARHPTDEDRRSLMARLEELGCLPTE
jgi:hypothetical protein